MARWLPLLLVPATLLAYANSFSAPFVFDDQKWIVDNLEIRSLDDPLRVVSGTNRPVLQLSFALNYAVGGLDVTGYHAVNVAIHILCALALFGVVRRIAARATGDGSARRLAFAAALLWAVHPLQTQAVTYVVQRGESLAGLFYLATLYGGVRLCEDSRALRFGVLAVLACALGMATKAIVVTAPIAVLLCDRTFFAASFADALRRRTLFYGCLFATWGVLAAVLRDFTEGVGPGAGSPLAYALTQPGVIAHYLGLAAWPHPLCFDYRWPLATTLSEIAPPSLVVVPLVLVAALGVARRAWWGFVGAWFFLVLAPTSSVLPIADPAFEHRMYLPLASLTVLAVIAVHSAIARCGLRPGVRNGAATALLVIAALALGATTARRNRDYRSGIALWETAARAAPANPRPHQSLGILLATAGRAEEAREHFLTAAQLEPGWPEPMVSLGYLFARRGDAAEAERWYARAVAAAPRHAEARLGLASALFDLGRDSEVRVHLREALSTPGAHLARAQALDGRVRERAGDLDGALASFRAAFGSAPDDAEIRGLLGLALHHRQRDGEALVHLGEARRLGLDAAEVHLALGVILTGRGHERAGIDALRDALRARPDWPVAANNLAWHLATTRDPSLRDADEAILLAERAALATGRRDVEVLDTLATALAAAGRRSDALRVAGEALARARESGDAETIRAGEARLATTRAAGDAPGAARGAP